MHSVFLELGITSFFVCQRQTNKRKNAFAWMFSCVVILLCFVFPIASFVADVAFFVECSDHFNETRKLLDNAREQTFFYAMSTNANTAINSSLHLIRTYEENRFGSALHLMDSGMENIVSKPQTSEVNRNKTLHTGTKLEKSYAPAPLYLPAFTEQIKTVSSIPTGAGITTNAPHPDHKNILDTVMAAHCYCK